MEFAEGSDERLDSGVGGGGFGFGVHSGGALFVLYLQDRNLFAERSWSKQARDCCFCSNERGEWVVMKRLSLWFWNHDYFHNHTDDDTQRSHSYSLTLLTEVLPFIVAVLPSMGTLLPLSLGKAIRYYVRICTQQASIAARCFHPSFNTYFTVMTVSKIHSKSNFLVLSRGITEHVCKADAIFATCTYMLKDELKNANYGRTLKPP